MWMATFSDLVTLLLTFFVVMMAMANFDDTERVEAVVTSIHTAFGVGGRDARVVQVSKKEAFTREDERTQVITPVVARLRESFANHVSDHYIEMSETESELRIRLDGRVFFRLGSSELHPAAYPLLADVGAVLAEEKVNLRIEGYADGMGDEHKNWQLSTERAVAVVMALREKGPIPGKMMEATGFGSFHPGVEIGRDAAWDRRVELVIQTKDMGGAAAASRMSDGGSNGTE
jgi:chemotaxis protein MotB